MEGPVKGKGFKMKGHTLPGINQRSEGNTDLPDGRSASSALQQRIGNPEGGGSPDMDFATKKSTPRKIDFGKTRDLGATWDELEQDRANPEIVKEEGTSLEQRRLREDRKSPAKYEKDPESFEYRKKVERYHKSPSPTGRREKAGPPESPKAIKTKRAEFMKTIRKQSNTPIGSAENKALSDKSWKQSRELNEAEKYIRK